MNYLILSPHFPPNFINFSIALRRQGANVLGVGDTPYDNLPTSLQLALIDYYQVDNLHNTRQVGIAIEQFIRKFGPIHGIDSHNEYWLETEAYLRERFNIPGPLMKDMELFRRKSVMKEYFGKSGLNVADSILADSFEKAVEFTRSTGYPIIAKPDKGVGGLGVIKIRNEGELTAFFGSKPHGQYLFEQFIDGTIITFDGLAGSEGLPVFYTSMQYGHGVMDILHDDLHTYFYTVRDLEHDLVEAGLHLLETFRITNRFFHFEFFREHRSGSLYAIEINMRPPGGYILDMFNFSSDIDLYDAWARLVSGNFNGLSYDRKYYVCFMSRKNRYAYRLSHGQVLNRFAGNLVLESPVSEVFSRGMGNHC